MRMIFLGAPGTGKGTQASVLAGKYSIPQISTGDILRKAVQDDTELGRKAKAVMEAGELVPDDVIINLVNERLSQSDCRRGYILDGFPRTLAQAESLDQLQAIDAVIYLDVDNRVIIDRLTTRRVCRGCGKLYNVATDPPPASGRCDVCGGEIYQRDDDSEETVRNRLDVYYEKTAPLKSYYQDRGVLHIIDGNRPIEEVRADIATVFNRFSRS